MPLRTFGELQRRDFNHAVHLRSVGDMYPLVDRKARDLPELMVAVRAKRTDTVGGEGCVLGEFMIYGFKLSACAEFVLYHCCYTSNRNGI